MTNDDAVTARSDSEGEAGRPYDYVRRLFTADSDRFDLLFTASLFVFMGYFIAASFDLRPEARLVPLVIAVPTFLIFALVLLLLVSERASAMATEFSDTHLFGTGQDDLPGGETEDVDDETDRERELFERRKQTAISLTVVFSLLVLVYLIGFLATIPIFLIAIYRLHAKQSWPVTVGTTLLVWWFVVIVFYGLLGVRLWEGVLEVDVVQYLPF